MNYTSRSAVETYQRCKRRRYIEYFWNGRGIAPVRTGVELMTGSATHEGLAILHIQWQDGIAPSIKGAVACALSTLKTLWKEPESEIDKFHFDEQSALVEAMLRAYHSWLLPRLMSRYKVLAIEQEIDFQLSRNTVFEARPDLIVEDLTSKDVLVLDYKTLANFDTRRERMVSVDLQGITEAIATQKWLEQTSSCMKSALALFQSRVRSANFQSKVVPFLANQMESLPVNVTGTKMIFLLKGIRKEEKYKGLGTGRFVTNSSLIYGYEQDTPSGKLYAHSWFYPNESNQSGYGTLGRSWKKFPVWKMEGGVERWIELISEKVIDHQTGKEIPTMQPECGDILEQQFWLPVQRFRNADQVDSTLVEISSQEDDCFTAVRYSSDDVSVRAISDLDAYFPRSRHSCYYPSTCPFVDICFKKETFELARENTEAAGYRYRVPNHPLERKQHLELFGEAAKGSESGKGEAEIVWDGLEEIE